LIPGTPDFEEGKDRRRICQEPLTPERLPRRDPTLKSERRKPALPIFILGFVTSEQLTRRQAETEPTRRVDVALPPGVVSILGAANVLLIVTAILRRALAGRDR